MTTISPAPDARDVLLAFAAEGDPTPKRLERYVNEHPGLVRDLTELAVELVLAPARDLPAADATTARAVEGAWARLQAGDAARRAESQEAGSTADLFASAAGPAFPQLARRLDVSPAFLLKVRDSLVEPTGFPRWLAARIGQELGQAASAVLAHLDRTPSIPMATMMKADGKPRTFSKQTFAEAVATSGMTEAQRATLLRADGDELGPD